MNQIRRAFAWIGRLIAKDSFAVFAMCGVLLIAQYHVNVASRWTAECDDRKYELLTMKLGMLEATLKHSDGLIVELRSQVMAHDSGQKWKLTDTTELDESLQSLDAVYAKILASEPKRVEVCSHFNDFRDQSILFFTFIGAMLTLFGFQIGKSVERKAIVRRRKK